MSDQRLAAWEKPWVRDFRGLNRTRPTADERGLEPSPPPSRAQRPTTSSAASNGPAHKRRPTTRPPTAQRQAIPSFGREPVIVGKVGESRRYGSIRTAGGDGGPPFRSPGVYSQSGLDGYEYRQDRVIGSARVAKLADAMAIEAMASLQDDPNRYFPFRVIGHEGETDIQLGKKYDLTNRETSPLFPLPPGRFPIQVTQVTPTSFTFTTQPGHFDAKDSTITFSTWADDAGRVHLEHLGIAKASSDPSPKFLVAPAMAEKTWDIQAANLSSMLRTSAFR